jgi:hypothetical protein
MATAPKIYMASGKVPSGDAQAVKTAVRAAIRELQEMLHAHGIEASFADIALLGHSESWDHEGQRWVHVRWDG